MEKVQYRFSAFARQGSLVLTFLTGLSALVYEVAWQKYLANFLGSAAQATASILAVFLGGLCLGYLLFGKWSRRLPGPRLVLVVGVSELIIGFWALLFPNLYEWVWSLGGIIDPLSSFSLLFELALSFALIGIPTILMGGTLPLLTQGLSYDLDDARGFHARVYATNTAGAFLGCLLAGFYFLPNLGLHETMRNVALINIAAGFLLCLIAFVLGKAADVQNSPNQLFNSDDKNAIALSEETPLEEEDAPPPAGSLAPWRACCIAAIAGFTSLCLQTIFIRLTGLTMGSSEYSFSMIVAVFVCMLAFGSWLVSLREQASNQISKNQLLVLLGTSLVFVSGSYWPYICYLLRLNISSYNESFYVYHAACFLLLAIVLAFPVGMMGATMPRLFGEVASSPKLLGELVGRLYAWNTLGCVLGALCGGYFLLYIMDLDAVYKLCLYLFILSFYLSQPARNFSDQLARRSIPVMCITLAALIFLLPGWQKAWLGTGLFRARAAYSYRLEGASEFYRTYLGHSAQLFYRDGPNTTAAVSESKADPMNRQLNNGATYIRNLKVNGKSDGETSIDDMRTMRSCAHLPMLLSPEPVRKIGVIGFGLGVAAGTTTLYPEVEKVDVMEISPAVIWASPLFDFANYGVHKNPKIKIRLGDAYRTLTSSKEKYSLIISEPSNPWVTGVERLFAKEFYDIVKSRLEPKGIYLQWIHEYSLSDTTLELVFRTFMRSFPHVRVFRADSDIIMLGSFEALGEESAKKMKERYEALPLVQESLRQIGMFNLANLMGTEVWVHPEQFPGDDIQTLAFPKLALRAGKDFFIDADAELGKMLLEPGRRVWARKAMRTSMIRYLLPLVEDQNQAIVDYAKGACDSTTLSLNWNWDQKPEPCQASIVAAAVYGQITNIDSIKHRKDFALLQELLSAHGETDPLEWMSYVSGLEPSDLDVIISLYEGYDGLFTPLSLQRLQIVSTACQKQDPAYAARCRARLVRAYATIGHPMLAREVLKDVVENYRKRLDPDEVTLLEQVVTTSEKAWQSNDTSPK